MVEIDSQHYMRRDLCPDECLCCNPTKEDVARAVAEYRREHAHDYVYSVYVLECKRRSQTNALTRACSDLQIQNPWWVRRAADADRLLYVGMSSEVVNRLWKHVRGHGAGANFTDVFPPVRVLDVTWYPRETLTYEREEETAEELRERYPGSYVSQPA